MLTSIIDNQATGAKRYFALQTTHIQKLLIV